MKKKITSLDGQPDPNELFNVFLKTERIAKIGSWEFDIRTKEFIWTDGMYDLFGMEKGIPVEPSIYRKAATPEDKKIADEIIKKIETADIINSRIRIMNNDTSKLLSVKSCVEYDDQKNAIKVFGIDQEITEESELPLSVYGFGKNAPLSIALAHPVSTNGEITDFEIVMFRNSLDEKENPDYKGKSFLESWPAVKKFMPIFIEVLKTSKPQLIEAQYDIDNPNAWLRLSIVKYDEGLVFVWDDISSRKQVEAELQHMNLQYELKSHDLNSIAADLKTFNVIAAHEFEENLKKIYTGLEFIAVGDAKNLSNEGRANVRRVQATVQKMKLIVSDIITYSNIRIENEKKIWLNIQNFIQLNAEAVSEKDGRMLQVEIENLNEIYAYPGLVSTLIHHLLDKALKFNNSKNPFLKISFKEVTSDAVPDAGINGFEKYIAVSFTDNGIGFNNSDSSSIFNIFFKSHDKSNFKGSGIGLAICKKIMDIHHGAIYAESKKGESTNITCYFPVINI